jgi:tetratricopeptide (TPR) repeat protein
VLLHAANAALVFLALRSLTDAFWRSAAAAALFALHPLRVESVAWVAERKDVLSVFFGLLTVWAYACYARAPSPGRYAAVVVAFVLALMAKPMLVTVPLLLLVLDWWPLERWPAQTAWRLLREKIPLFAAAAVVCGLVATLGQARDRMQVGLTTFPPAVRVENALVSYAAYLGMSVWPDDLAVLYPHPVYNYDGQGGLAPWQLTCSVILLAAVTVVAVKLRRRAPYVLAGWLWYVLALVPVIGLVQAGAQARADRFTYLPHVGVAIAVVWGVAAAAANRPRLVAAVLTAAVAALVFCTEAQLPTWHDSLTLWQHALKSTRKTPESLTHLGGALAAAGRDDEAAGQYAEALRLDKDSAFAHIGLGNLLQRQGKLDSAAEHLRAACAVRPDLAEAHTDLGVVYFRQGKLEEAAREHREAIRLNPELFAGYSNLGQVELARSNLSEARDCYRQALLLQPQDWQIRANLGYVLCRCGQSQEGLALLHEAVRANPAFGLGHLFLGLALESAGDHQTALAHLQQAVHYRPELANQIEGLLAQDRVNRRQNRP